MVRSFNATGKDLPLLFTCGMKLPARMGDGGRDYEGDSKVRFRYRWFRALARILAKVQREQPVQGW